jgi:predicted hotdog family 3-hydroxylacyl-ACP dehydratase
MTMLTAMRDIEACIPHRGAMRLVHRILAHDDDSIVVEADVPFDGLFVERAGMPAWIGIEYMAQAIAAWAGARACDRGEGPKLGFLLGTRRYTSACSHFASGAVLRVEARREIMGDNGLGVFDCRILCDGEELASAHVSVFEPADASVFLQGAPA